MNHLTSFMQQVKEIWLKQDAVTSLEYALMGTLIAVVIIVGASLVGTNTAGKFTLAANCVVFAVSGTGGCS